MEDYFYILIGILWVVFSVIKASRKNNQPQPHEGSEETGRRTTLEDILGELLEKEEYTEPDTVTRKTSEATVTSSEINQPVYESLEAEYTQPSLYSQYTGEITDDNLLKGIYESLEDDTEVKSMTINNLSDSDNTITETRTETQNHSFDLRKAVIYSVILERPYA
jgi:hypothetical protein